MCIRYGIQEMESRWKKIFPKKKSSEGGAEWAELAHVLAYAI
jgi:hypothetical protein